MVHAAAHASLWLVNTDRETKAQCTVVARFVKKHFDPGGALLLFVSAWLGGGRN